MRSDSTHTPPTVPADDLPPGAPAKGGMKTAPGTNGFDDLTTEKLLRDAPRVDCGDGTTTPSLGGIPLRKKLGEGGMGAVYWGVHPRLERDVAVKVLPSHLADKNADFVRRFKREARIAAKIQSPHLVTVFDVNEESGLYYLVMECVAGASAQKFLREHVGNAQVDEATALDICIAACTGLAAAHAAGVIHRDVKPDNILIPRDGASGPFQFKKAKLADLGIARVETSDNSLLTGANQAMGTPGYMSPEQCKDAATCGAQSDVFAMGATVFELLTGARPFTGTNGFAILQSTVSDAHPNVRKIRPDISEHTAKLIDRCLAKKPDQRYADASILLDVLIDARTAMTPVPQASRLPVYVLAAAACLAIITYIAWPKPAPPTEANNRVTPFGQVAPFAPVTTFTGPGKGDTTPPAPDPAVLAETKKKQKEAEEAAAKLADDQRTLDAQKADLAKAVTQYQQNMAATEKAKQAAAAKEKADAAAKVETERLAALEKKREDEARQKEIARLQGLKDEAERLAREKAAQVPAKEMSLDLGGGVTMELVRIKAGSFTMGSPESELERFANEKQHRVTISNDFYMGKYAVTQEQYEAVMGTNPSYFTKEKGGGLKHPVEQVSWNDAMDFCKKVSARSGKTIVLPTEAQWEFACRAGTTTPFNFEGQISAEKVNYNATYTYDGSAKGLYREKTTPVGTFAPNKWGLYDMHGNVYQWCWDVYMNGYETLVEKDPFNAGKPDEARVLRGGSWIFFPRFCRSAFRLSLTPDDRLNYVGFRIVIPLDFP